MNVQTATLVPQNDPVPAKAPVRENPVPPIVIVAPPLAPPVLGPIAERWKREFGREPREMSWPALPGLGEFRINETFSALSLQAMDSMRLVQLGDSIPKMGSCKLSVDIMPQLSLMPQSSQFGIFLGLQADDEDHPRTLQFQAIQIRPSDHLPPKRSWIVSRCRAHWDLRMNKIASGYYCETMFLLPDDQKKLQLELNFFSSELTSVLFCGKVCENICDSRRRNSYKQSPDRFGVFVSDGSAFFSNPRFKTAAP